MSAAPGIPATPEECILLTLCEMRASGSWDVKTLNRAVELTQNIIRDYRVAAKAKGGAP